MTFFNVISILIFVIILAVSIALRLFLKRRINEADGMGEVHERKEEKGDNVASVGRNNAGL